MNRFGFKLLTAGIMSLMLILSGCGSDVATTTASGAVGTGDGTKTGEVNTDGIDTGIAATATTVAGKVTLSSVLSAKARAKTAREKATRHGKPGSAAYNSALSKALSKQRALPSFAANVAFSNGTVYLYNAKHPEWRYPVAKATTDADGVYTLESLINAEKNKASYTDGAAIPGGNYTLLAFTEKDYGLFKLPELVALQSVVSEFAGSISGIDLEANQSTAAPAVTTMLGVSKNSDGTQSWGGSDLELAPNAAVQVAFSLPMFREAIDTSHLTITSTDGGTVPDGIWTLSADWLTATYYPKAGETWTPGKTFTVKVTGSDGALGIVGSIYNIYGRFMEKSGVGTFKILELTGTQTIADLVDTVAPTAQIASPTLAQTASAIEITTPLRIASNERMDVNGLRLKAVPSLGAQPGVLFIGKNKDSLYEYEFLLGEPLKLGTSYTVTVSGGKDLAGNTMNELKVSFATVATTDGIAVITATEGTAEYVEQVAKSNNQADVKDVFGKWVRAMNDRNLPQIQNLMSGEFVMKYNSTSGFKKEDLNRDGVLGMDEFAAMLKASFLSWKACEISMTGAVVGDIVVTKAENLPAEANFAFTLTSTAGVSSPTCKQAAVNQKLFAKLLKVNGSWRIKRAAEDVDIREENTAAVVASVNLLTPADRNTPDASGILPTDLVMDDVTSVPFKWDAYDAATGYIWIVVDTRDPTSGFAIIVPDTRTELNVPSDIDTLMDQGVVADVSKDFGFENSFEPRDGSVLFWQVAALGTYTVEDVTGSRAKDLPGDVIAMSGIREFKLAGEYKTLAYTVAPNSSDLQTFKDKKGSGEGYEARFTDQVGGTPVNFNEVNGGYDLGASNFATISITSPDTTATRGFIEINGNTRIEQEITLVDGVGSINVILNQGNNQIMLVDAVPCWFEADFSAGDPCEGQKDSSDGIREWFNVTTTGGIRPVIVLDAAVDSDTDGVLESSGVTLVNEAGTDTPQDVNAWNWYESTDAVTVKLSGKVDFTVGALGGKKPDAVNIYVGNEQGAAARRKAQVDATTGVFSTEIEVFKGDNWVDIQTNICTMETKAGEGCPQFAWREFRVNMGIFTEAGSVYTPPIHDIIVSDDEAQTVVIAQKDNWGFGGRWNATAAVDNQVVISGVLEFASDSSDSTKKPQYNIGGAGGWQGGDLPVSLDGSFSLVVDLFKGENWIDIRDVQENNYNLNVFTDGGKAVVLPEIRKIDGVDFVAGTRVVSTDQCSITIDGVAQPGEVVAEWKGEKDGVAGSEPVWVREEVRTQAKVVSPATEATYSVTLPLLGSSDATVRTFNRIRINDKVWNGIDLEVQSTGNCDYVEPIVTVSSVIDDTDHTLSKVVDQNDPNGNRAQYVPVGSTDYNRQVDTDVIAINGTSNVSGRAVFVNVNSCGGAITYATTADLTDTDADGLYNWTIADVDVYNGHNNMVVYMGSPHDWDKNQQIELSALSGTPSPAPLMSIGSIVGADEVGEVTVTQDTSQPMPCGQTRWNAGAADSLTVVINSDGLDGRGEWRSEDDSARGFFEIVAGTVTIAINQLYAGEQRFEAWDYNGNRTEFFVTTTGGVTKPELVTFAVNGTALADPIAPGTLALLVTVKADPNADGSTFKLQDFELSVFVDGMQKRFVNKPHMLWGNIGDQLIAFTQATPTSDYTFTATIDVPADSVDSSKGARIEMWGFVNGEKMDASNNPQGWVNYNFNEKFNDSGMSGGGSVGSGGSVDSGGSKLGAMPAGSTNVMLTSPAMDATVNPSAIVVSGTINPALSGTQVARLMVFDPTSQTGPIAIMTSHANDPLLGGTVDSSMMLTIDANGGFNTTLNVATVLQKYQISVMVWADSAVTEADGPGEPMYGYMVEVMAQ